MSSALRQHLADPHLLLKTQYDITTAHICDICRCKLAGLTGYRCNACGLDIHDHEACADYFKETTSFFAHPWHALTLARMPSSCVGYVCDLCREGCPPGTLVYRCADCLFDVHPLCTMLPQTIRSPLHPQHDLRMVPASGTCSACCKDLPVWHYVSSCTFRLHIACVSGAPSGGNSDDATSTTASGRNNNTTNGHVTGSRQHAGQTAAAAQGSSAIQTASSSGDSGRSSSVVAKILLEQSFRLAINVATGGMASPVLDVLSAAFD